jgi:hypothetical protein
MASRNQLTKMAVDQSSNRVPNVFDQTFGATSSAATLSLFHFLTFY